MHVPMDADFSHDLRYLPEMLAAAESVDVCIGSRHVPGGGTQGWEPWRRFLSAFANRYCRAITRMPLHDMTAGFMVIRAEVLARAKINALDNSGYAFLMELKYLLWKTGATFAEMPIVFKERREGESKISNHIIFEGVSAPWKMTWKHR
jgi:dolichol-phosphate mannosyltransferase